MYSRQREVVLLNAPSVRRLQYGGGSELQGHPKTSLEKSGCLLSDMGLEIFFLPTMFLQ